MSLYAYISTGNPMEEWNLLILVQGVFLMALYYLRALDQQGDT